MLSPWPELARDYGEFIEQACKSCPWHRKDLHHELKNCPQCNAELKGDVELRFGGMRIKFHAALNQFTIRPRHDRYAEMVIEDADMPETLLFLMRHWVPWDEATRELFGRLGLYDKLNEK